MMDDFEIRITYSGSLKRYTEIFPEGEGATFMEYNIENTGILRCMTARGHGNRYIVFAFNASNGELYNTRMSLAAKGLSRFFDISYNPSYNLTYNYKFMKYVDIQKGICRFQKEFF